jgi:hypothetical protein
LVPTPLVWGTTMTTAGISDVAELCGAFEMPRHPVRRAIKTRKIGSLANCWFDISDSLPVARQTATAPFVTVNLSIGLSRFSTTLKGPRTELYKSPDAPYWSILTTRLNLLTQFN